MVENNREMPVGLNEVVAIARARDAAIECVRAVASFSKTVKQADHNARNKRARLPVRFDYRPYVAYIYRSLRLGWDRIGRVCPQLIEAYPQLFHDWRVLPEYRSDPLVFTWLLACERFWFWIRDTAHELSALEAWINWDETYAPDLRDYPRGDHVVWDRWELEGVSSGTKRLNHDFLIAGINAALPATSAWVGLRDQPLPPPATLLQPKPLPQQEAELRRLHENLIKVVAETEGIWKPFSRTLESALQDSRTSQGVLRKSIRDWESKLSCHFCVIGSRFHIPPLEVAIARARFTRACWELSRAVEDGEPDRQDAKLRLQVDVVIHSGTELLNIAKRRLNELDHEVCLCSLRLAKRSLASPATATPDEGQDPQNVSSLQDSSKTIGEGFLSAQQLAEKHGVEFEALRKRLERWRNRNSDLWGKKFKEVADLRGHGAKWLYLEDAVKEIILGLQKKQKDAGQAST